MHQEEFARLPKPIGIGADDAAVELKAQIVKHLESKGIPVQDYGLFNADPMLYPDIALEVAQAVAEEIGLALGSNRVAARINAGNGSKPARICDINSQPMGAPSFSPYHDGFRRRFHLSRITNHLSLHLFARAGQTPDLLDSSS